MVTKEEIERDVFGVDVPIGQLALRAGFKPITRKALEDRLGCTAFNIKQLGIRSKNNMLRHKKEMMYFATLVLFMASASATAIGGLYLSPLLLIPTYILYLSKNIMINLNDILWSKIVIQNLDSFVKEEIPPRVLNSIQRAREIGICKFQVVHAVVVEVPMVDPIVIGCLGDTDVEIDSWE